MPLSPSLDALRALPIPDLMERDPFALKALFVAEFERISGRTLFESQPEMYVIETMAYALSVYGEAGQNGFMQNRALWAEGGHLEQVGANVDTFKLGEEYAVCQIEFSLSGVQPTNVLIPAGTRVSPGNGIIFDTTDDLFIEAGQLTGLVLVIALDAGVSANGFVIGQINEILDPVAFVASASNTIASGGGADVEDEDAFRLRIINSFERISKAGPRQGYVEIVKSASALIVDVAVHKPQPGYIDIYPLTATGAASDALDTLIIAALDPEKVVPMGDYVTVKKAVAVPLDITLNVRVFNAGASILADIEDAVLAAFLPWSLTLGAQLSPLAVKTAVGKLAGVIDVVLPDFAYVDLAHNQYADISEIAINLVESPNV